MNLPTREESLNMLKATGCCKGVIEHCINVTKIAVRLAEKFREKGIDVDINLVESGAILHDIGRSITHDIKHGVEGGKIARKMGLPSAITSIIERHIGAGIPAEEAEKLGLPKENFIPEELEEKIVAYADKLVEGHREVDIEVTVEKLSDELGRSHPALDRLRALHDEMVSILEQDRDIS